MQQKWRRLTRAAGEGRGCPRERYIPTTDQSDAGSVGIFSRWTNHLLEGGAAGGVGVPTAVLVSADDEQISHVVAHTTSRIPPVVV
eukprot:3100593-Pyramimonas_sp.AAC.1